MDNTTDPNGVTSSIDSLVGIVLFSVNAAIFHDELEGVVHEASIAAFVVGARVAVH